MRRTAASLALLGLLGLLVAGCGKSDQDKAKDTVEDFVAASNDQDWDKLCGLLGKDALEQYGGSTQDCVKQLKQQTSGSKPPKTTVDVRKVTINKDTATAEAVFKVSKGPQQKAQIPLEKADGDWKIASLVAGGPSGQ